MGVTVAIGCGGVGLSVDVAVTVGVGVLLAAAVFVGVTVSVSLIISAVFATNSAVGASSICAVSTANRRHEESMIENSTVNTAMCFIARL